MQKSLHYLVWLMVASLSVTRSCMANEQRFPELPLHEQRLHERWLNERWLHIFIHGTMMHGPLTSWQLFRRYMNNTLDDTIYARVVEASRHHEWLLRLQPIQQLGLHSAPFHEQIAHGKEYPLAWFIESYHAANIVRNPQASHAYYTFGWNGLVSHTGRIRAAHELHAQLAQLIAQQQELYPQDVIKISLVGFSHGGTVAALLAASSPTASSGFAASSASAPVFAKATTGSRKATQPSPSSSTSDSHPNTAETAAQHPLVIDELILLGVPASAELNELLTHSMFKKIFYFYSRADIWQAVGCMSHKQFRLKRRLTKTHPRQWQIELKLFGITPKCPRYGVDHSPQHIEWWFFGWSPGDYYRSNFPLYPLPAAICVPLVLHALESVSMPAQSLVCAYTPQKGKLSLKKRHASKKVRFAMPTPACWKDISDRMNVHYNSKLSYTEYVDILKTIHDEVCHTCNRDHMSKKSDIDSCCARDAKSCALTCVIS